MRILLIRHGSTDLLGRVLYGRMPGIHLNAEGEVQARNVAEALKQRYRVSDADREPMAVHADVMNVVRSLAK